MLWVLPVTVPVQVSDDGEVSVRVPAPSVRVPVRVQDVPATTAEPQPAAMAAVEPRVIEPVASTAAAKTATPLARRIRRIDITRSYVGVPVSNGM